MSRQIIPDRALDILRTIGDPGPHQSMTSGAQSEWFSCDDAERDMILSLVRARGVGALAADGQARVWVREASKLVPPEPVDTHKVCLARSLFAEYGSEITSALLLAALPQAYAAEEGSKVLAATHQLQSNLTRRIAGTGQFLATVMAARTGDDATKADWTVPWPAGAPAPGSSCWKHCAALRVYHEAVRRTVQGKTALRAGDVPINQEDLLGMLLSFSVTTFEVLESYGIRWTTDEQEAYLYLWDLVGAHLGIGSPFVVARLEQEYSAYPSRPTIANASWHGLRPPTIDDTRALLAQIQKRQWPDPGPTYLSPNDKEPLQTTKAGRLLVRALLDELVRAMPARDRLLPLSIMRQLNPAIVRSRLNLGGGGALLAGLQNLPKRRAVIGPFTVTPVSIPFIGRLQRQMGNEVARRTSLMYLQQGRLKVPGIDLRPIARSTLPPPPACQQ